MIASQQRHSARRDALPEDSLAHALTLAAAAIAAVIGGRSLDAALADCWRGHGSLTAATRGAVQDLAYGALRRYGRGDFLLTQLLHAPLRETQLRALLLAALYRLASRPEDGHTTVDQAVAAAASIRRGKYRALANALLRNYLRRREELEALADAQPSARHQHPDWWIAALAESYPDAWQNLLAAGNERPTMCLRLNPRRTDLAAYLAELAERGIAARAMGAMGVMLEQPVPVARLPGFNEGRVSVQDWGAQQAAPLLAAEAGMRVLDACAAPGGKSAHLLELADIDLLALDVDAGRAARIGDNFDRLVLKAQVGVADCRHPELWWDGRPFQRILADVPCSASGVVRRHPDSKWLRRAADISGYAAVQGEILDALWRVLAPDGKMLYCTCSLFPQENAQQIAAFARRHYDAVLLPTGPAGRPGHQHWQLLPQRKHDGFFYALLWKHGPP